ncbi:hypothetical protein OE749_09775 [Aestuariibacter sp. AA17]|uniref:Bacterial extracellular solute-binding proteins, family 3 n=1 Tax=Fluctibacter corallii TaxID=2984329 RepID=A0ABT3A8H1_9ALTE|nr:hypothetical protein [Aestuariibacter sp. AA17]MCV2884984.1 hypothetical protein [Aestuariibacter sp. AA17]
MQPWRDYFYSSKTVKSITLLCCMSASLVAFTLFANPHDKEGNPHTTDPITFIVGVEDIDYYPYYAFVDSPHNNGFLRTILEQFGKAHHYQFEFIPLPVKRFDHWYEESKIDFRLPDNPLWHGREQQSLIYSAPILTLSTGTVVPKIAQYRPLREFGVIGTITGFVASPHWADMSASNELEIVNDVTVRSLVRLLYEGVIEGIDIDLYTSRYYAREMGFDESQIVYAAHVPSLEVQYYLSTIKHNHVIEEFNQYLNEHQSEIADIISNARKE